MQIKFSEPQLLYFVLWLRACISITAMNWNLNIKLKVYEILSVFFYFYISVTHPGNGIKDFKVGELINQPNQNIVRVGPSVFIYLAHIFFLIFSRSDLNEKIIFFFLLFLPCQVVLNRTKKKRIKKFYISCQTLMGVKQTIKAKSK